MKKTFLIVLVTLLVALPVTWFAARRHARTASAPTEAAGRKVLYYQSAMHPWIKSDQPGRCTICGMELTPIYEGQRGVEPVEDVVMLEPNMIQVLNVATARAQRQPLLKTLSFAGIVDDDARKHYIISAYVDGRIDKLYINHHGVEVTAGEPLAEIYSPTLLQAEREYRSLSGELRDNTAFRLRQLGLSLEQIAALPNKPVHALTSEILSPITGTVVNHEVASGQYVTVGQKLFEVADFSIMWLVFPAYEQDLPWLKEGQSVQVTTPSVAGKEFTGVISFIDPNLNPQTRAAQVRVELPNPLVDDRRLLLHRVSADLVVSLDAPVVLTVPRSAVLEIGPEAVVYVDHGDGIYERTVVKLGRRGDKLVEIVSGLSEGDKVVTNGNLLLDGQAEMNRSFGAEEHESTHRHTDATPLTDVEKEAIVKFIQAADAIARALAADDLARFNAVTPNIKSATESLTAALAHRSELAPLLGKLAPTGRLSTATDLPAARKTFHAFSTAATALASALHQLKGMPPFDVFECPMVDQGVPGAPKRGRWLQIAGREMANPFMGRRMAECGEKIELPKAP